MSGTEPSILTAKGREGLVLIHTRSSEGAVWYACRSRHALRGKTGPEFLVMAVLGTWYWQDGNIRTSDRSLLGPAPLNPTSRALAGCWNRTRPRRAACTKQDDWRQACPITGRDTVLYGKQGHGGKGRLCIVAAWGLVSQRRLAHPGEHSRHSPEGPEGLVGKESLGRGKECRACAIRQSGPQSEPLMAGWAWSMPSPGHLAWTFH